MILHEALVFSAVSRRTVSTSAVRTGPQRLKSGRGGCGWPAAAAPGGRMSGPADRPCRTCAWTSAVLIRPSWPLPATAWMSTPSSRASRRTDGAAGAAGRRGPSSAGAEPAAASSAPRSSFVGAGASGAWCGAPSSAATRSCPAASSPSFSGGGVSAGDVSAAGTSTSADGSGARSCSASWSPSLVTSMRAMTWPTLTSSPAATRISLTWPAKGDGISTTAFSVSNSSRTASASM